MTMSSTNVLDSLACCPSSGISLPGPTGYRLSIDIWTVYFGAAKLLVLVVPSLDGLTARFRVCMYKYCSK